MPSLGHDYITRIMVPSLGKPRTPLLHEPDRAELQLNWCQGIQPVGHKAPNYLVYISSLSPALQFCILSLFTRFSPSIFQQPTVAIVLRGEPYVYSMIWWREGEEKESIYIQRIIRENFDALPLLSHSPLWVTCHWICNTYCRMRTCIVSLSSVCKIMRS